MIEFTGERVVPGEVNDDLWAEHVARYAFASRFADRKRVLDLGCGAGYGVAELAHRAAFVTGVDPAAEAIQYARAHYPLPNAHFIEASATALPFAERSFDLATAFEVIEHLSDWRALLAETSRVLDRDGIFLVSTPNKIYYADARAREGPNPFHAHEFEFDEFREALAQFFPSVSILLQNRLESFSFSPHQTVFPPLDARVDGTRGSPAEAHFFVAICSTGVTPELRSFLYVPRAANLLRERELHIRMLTDDLDRVIKERQELLEIHDQQTRHLEQQNRWALQLDQALKAALQRIAQVQDELKEVAEQYSCKVEELEDEVRGRTEWAIEIETRLSTDLAAKCAELAEAVRLLDAAEATVVERTRWAQELDSRLKPLEAQFRMLRESRWLKLGRVAGLGPRVDD